MTKRTLVLIETIILIFGGGLLRLVFDQFLGFRASMLVSYLLWGVVLWLVSSRVTAARRRDLARLWQLADALGVDASDLSRRTSYGAIDWQLTRPDNLQFYPADATVARLTRELEQAAANQAQTQAE
ncbi:hypothetical protein [Lacticaseibacillus kribbianus]|uniref:hypothetical protein n=1 Tax=Lacticaseibacillus kribbianus TaxID=2926292 RepID=UPI001CD49C39|nr:hypothetical protein [Lacticaseibacillus kribbianus]